MEMYSRLKNSARDRPKGDNKVSTIDSAHMLFMFRMPAWGLEGSLAGASRLRRASAKHCWTGPRRGWVRSELSVLLPDVSCCLGELKGGWRSYTTTRQELQRKAGSGKRLSGGRKKKRERKKRKGKTKQTQKDESAASLPIASFRNAPLFD